MPSSLRAVLVVLVASAVAVNATPSLAVKTSVPNAEVDGLQNLKVTVSVFNTGSETLKLLNDPRGVLSSFPEHSFNIANANGSRPSFNGAKVYFSPTHAAGINDPSGFTVLAPGSSTNITHDLSAAYNFTRSGAGDYSIEPLNLFTYIDGDGALKDLYATVEDVAEVKLSGILAVSRHVYDKRDSPRFQGCSISQESDIIGAALFVNFYAKQAYNYLKTLSRLTDRYHKWFGWYSDLRIEIVKDHFSKISENSFLNFLYICSSEYPNWFAWVIPDNYGIIYIGPLFSELHDEGSDSKAGTLIHECSHFVKNGWCKDYQSGRINCENLAVYDPDWAVMNADSHRYFAMNDPHLD